MPGTGAGRPGGAIAPDSRNKKEQPSTPTSGNTAIPKTKETYVFPYAGGQNYNPRWATNTNDVQNGVTLEAPAGTQVVAIGEGIVHAGAPDNGGLGPAWVYLDLKKPVTIDGKTFSSVYYGGLSISTFSQGGINDVIDKEVKVGQPIGLSGGEGIEVGWHGGGTGSNKSGSGMSMRNWLQTLNTTSGASAISGSTGSGYSAEQIAISTGLTGYLNFPSVFNSAESQMLTGVRGMMNDVPLFPFIQTIADASLRKIMSLPNGKFYAFYPDYFGSLGTPPYWEIEDIEIISGRIDLSDDELYTHVFVVGDTVSFPDNQIDLADKLSTGGVVTIFNAFAAGFLNGPPSASDGGRSITSKNDALAFLAKYGARPKFEPAPYVRAPIYEAFIAYQTFCLYWSQQFQTTFELTFMPELYPGGIVSFPQHGIQCFVQEVTHNCDYQNGFTTNVVLTAPSAIRDNSGTAVDSNKSWVHSGMIRAINNNEVINYSRTSLPINNNKGKWKPGQ
jgi:hypothetical protein